MNPEAKVTMEFDGQELELLARAVELLNKGGDYRSRQYWILTQRLRQKKQEHHKAHGAVFAARFTLGVKI